VTLIGQPTLQAFAERHPDARGPLEQWARVTLAATWGKIGEARATYPTANGVPSRKGKRVVAVVTVFNVGGNKYRLLTLVNYSRQTVEVLDVLTHAEYDKEKWKRRLV
jgi:mRNA interferase HigB